MPDNDEPTPISEVTRAIDAQDGSALLAAAEDVHYADLAELYEHLNDGDRDFLLKTIGPTPPTWSRSFPNH